MRASSGAKGERALQLAKRFVEQLLVVEGHPERVSHACVVGGEALGLHELEGSLVETAELAEGAGVTAARLDVATIELDSPRERLGRVGPVGDVRVSRSELQPGERIVGVGVESLAQLGDDARAVAGEQTLERIGPLRCGAHHRQLLALGHRPKASRNRARPHMQEIDIARQSRG